MKKIQILIFALSFLLCQSNLVYANIFTADNIIKQFTGTWHLVSVLEKIDNQPAHPDPQWLNPDGYITYTNNGRMSVIIVSGNRKAAMNMTATNDEAAALFRSMTSYAGSYKVIGDKVVHHIEVSWNQKWSGSDQIRLYKIHGKHLTLTLLPTHEGKHTIIRSLYWKKIF